MANMSYVRFENTYKDLLDAYQHIWDDELSESEEQYRTGLIELCERIAYECGTDDDVDDKDEEDTED